MVRKDAGAPASPATRHTMAAATAAAAARVSATGALTGALTGAAMVAALTLAAPARGDPGGPRDPARAVTCTGSPEAMAQAASAALCAAIADTIGDAGTGPLAVHLDSLAPHLVRLRLSDPRDPARPSETLEFGLTDAALAPHHYRQLAGAVLAAARRAGLLPPS